MLQGEFAGLRHVTLDIPPKQVTVIVGPSDCGTGTLPRAMNRMNAVIAGVRVSGRLLFGSEDVYTPGCDPVDMCRRVGMVFQKPGPFCKSICRNVVCGPAVNGFGDSPAEPVEQSLCTAALWEEVKDKLNNGALVLSGVQQPRLCIARAVAMQPEVLLTDEPCPALDPIAAACIEDLIDQLKSRYTMVLVTHNIQQAARVSDRTAFMLVSELVEVDVTSRLFTAPGDRRTQDYITRRLGQERP